MGIKNKVKRGDKRNDILRKCKFVTLGLGMMFLLPITAQAGSLTSEVGITFVEPEDEEAKVLIQKAQEEFKNSQPTGIKTTYVNAPDDNNTYTTFIYNDRQVTMVTSNYNK